MCCLVRFLCLKNIGQVFSVKETQVTLFIESKSKDSICKLVRLVKRLGVLLSSSWLLLFGTNGQLAKTCLMSRWLDVIFFDGWVLPVMLVKVRHAEAFWELTT